MPPKSTYVSSTVDITNLDKQIETLMECKCLSEPEIKALCEKVSIHYIKFLTFLKKISRSKKS